MKLNIKETTYDLGCKVRCTLLKIHYDHMLLCVIGILCKAIDMKIVKNKNITSSIKAIVFITNPTSRMFSRDR